MFSIKHKTAALRAHTAAASVPGFIACSAFLFCFCSPPVARNSCSFQFRVPGGVCCLSGQCFCPSRTPTHGCVPAPACRDLQGTRDTTPDLCRAFCCMPRLPPFLASMALSCWKPVHRDEPLTQGSEGRPLNHTSTDAPLESSRDHAPENRDQVSAMLTATSKRKRHAGELARSAITIDVTAKWALCCPNHPSASNGRTACPRRVVGRQASRSLTTAKGTRQDIARTAIHPGQHLAEQLKELGMSAAELGRRLKVPTNRITGILNGQRAVTGDSALRLAHFFWHQS